MITGRQIKAARALLRWSQVTLSEKSGVSIAVIRRIEPQDDTPNVTANTLSRIEQCLNAAGVSFVMDNKRITIHQDFTESLAS